MTGEGTSLPEEIRNRIAGKRKEAFDAEIVSLESQIESELERHLSERSLHIEDLIEARKREIAEAREREMGELREFEIQTLQALETELHTRRNQRLAEQEEKRKSRLARGTKPDTPPKSAGSGDQADMASVQEDPSRKITKILKQAQQYLDQGEVELAEKIVSDGLQIDAFNPELINLDSKIRELLASDTFSQGAEAPAKPQAEEKKKTPAKPEKQERPAAKGSLLKVALKFLLIAAVIVTIGLGVIVALKYLPTPLQSRSTIAVLPWTVRGDDPDLQLFASTLPGETVKLLARASSPVNLVGYATTSNLAGMGGDPVRSLVRLGYSHFVRGRIELADSLFIVRAELVDSMGETRWSEEYRRSRADIMLVPYEIVHHLADFLEGDSAATQTLVEIKNPGAYRLYLEGQRALLTPGGEGIDLAITAFGRSVSLDPDLAPANAGLATAIAMKYAWGSGTGDILSDAGRAADEAIRQDPAISDGYLARARVRTEQRKYREAMDDLDSASRRSPRESHIPWLRGLIEFRTGMAADALESLREAYVLDPRNLEILRLAALVHLFNGSYDRAMWYQETAMYFSGDTTAYMVGPLSDVIMLDPTLTLTHSDRVTSACLNRLGRDPDDYYTLYRLARILQLTGDIEESNTYLRGLEGMLRSGITARPSDTRMRLYLGLTLTRMGRYADAISIGEAAVAADPGNAEARYLLAQIFAMQMYSPQTRSVDEEKKSRCLGVLKEAIALRFMDDQLGNADLYNVYAHTDIWTLLRTPGGEAQ